jgi:FSR family fosmidomycin resistance protein-like MFS transporter
MSGSFHNMGKKSMISFLALSITHCMVEIFLFMHLAILPLLMREFTITIVQAGLVLTIPNIIRLGSTIPSGVIADKMDSRYLLSLAAALSGFGAVIVSQSQNVAHLVVGLCMMMMAVSTYHPLGLNMISKLFIKEELTKMIGVHGATGSIGQGLGIISMSFMISSYEWRSCYLLWSIFLFVWSIILMKLPVQLPQSDTQRTTKQLELELCESMSVAGWKQRFLQIITEKSFLILIVAMGVAGLANQAVFSFTTTYFVQVRNLPENVAALIMGIAPVTTVFGSLIGGYLGSRFGDRRFLSFAFFGSAVLVFGLAYSRLTGFIILSFLGYRWFFASIWPASTSLVSTFTPGSSRGIAFSIFLLVPGTMSAISPTIGALIIEEFSILGIFQFALILFLFSSVILLPIRD